GPGAVCKNLTSLFNRFSQCLDMFFQIADPVLIVNLIFFCFLVKCAKSVFGNDNRKSITACNFTAAEPQSRWINAPVPVGCQKIWICRILIDSLNSHFLS